MPIKYTKFKDIPRFTSPGRYAVDYPLDHLVTCIHEFEEEQGLNLCPEFQRGHVWTKKQQVSYIEFLLRGGTTGRDLYFNCPGWHTSVAPGEYNEFTCVDGLQRITAIQQFCSDKIKVFGSYYSEYTDNLRFCTDTIRIHINDLKTEKEVIVWYLEMNFGGTPHSKKELERVHALLESLS